MTITIDTTKQKKPKLRLAKRRLNPTKGWHPQKRKQSWRDKFWLWRKASSRRFGMVERQVSMF